MGRRWWRQCGGWEPRLCREDGDLWPLVLRSAKGLGGASAVVEMWLAIKEKSGARLTRVAGGAG